MEVFFKNKKLQKYAENTKFSITKLGPQRSELYMRRIGDLMAAESLEDLRHAPGHYHDLVGDRKGQWACNLDHPYRLIFVPHEEPIPTDEGGKYIWIEIKSVIVINIEDYH